MPKRIKSQTKRMEAIGYLTAQAAAEKACVAPTTIYDWLNTDQIEGTRVGGLRYVLLKSLREHIGPEIFDKLNK